MVMEDSDIISQGEVETTLQSRQRQPRIHTIPSIGRQSSIYSLTLDEFQQSVSERGRNFGSMNMDEFLNSIWTAEENQATNTQVTNAKQSSIQKGNNASTSRGMPKQASLPREGPLSIPEPLSRKTVDEVWSDIHRSQPQHNSENQVQNPNTTERQPTFGEMTLEDFLVRAGVVREPNHPPPPAPLQQQPYVVYPNSNQYVAAPPYVNVGGSSNANVSAYQTLPPNSIEEGPGYSGGVKRAVGYTPQPISPVGFRQIQGLAMGSPVSPVAPDKMCANPVEGSNHYGMKMNGTKGGRRRIIDGPIERVVERRQRRMIKNRESAARSRARKQAYTVELEAELNQLKQENSHLKQALAKLERKRRQQYFEEARLKAQAQTKAQKTNEKMRVMRRSFSGPY